MLDRGNPQPALPVRVDSGDERKLALGHRRKIDARRRVANRIEYHQTDSGADPEPSVGGFVQRVYEIVFGGAVGELRQ